MLTIGKNTYVSELYAYLLLRDTLLEDRDVTIGDDIPNGLPDIHTDDKRVGIEVASIEETHVFELFNALHRDHIINNVSSILKQGAFDKLNMKFVNDRFKMAMPEKAGKFTVTPKKVNRAKNKLNYDKIMHALKVVIDKKLDRLNNKGSYDGCKNRFLFLVSDNITKKELTVNDYFKVYNRLTKNYAKKFDGVFVALNNKLYFMDKLNTIHIIKKPSEVIKVRREAKYRHMEQSLGVSFE